MIAIIHLISSFSLKSGELWIPSTGIGPKGTGEGSALALPPPTLLGNPRTLGGRGRARNTDQLFMGESIIQLPREGEGGVRPRSWRAAAETTPPD